MSTRNDKRQAEIVRAGGVPRHVSIIMDGNGRWARRRFLPRIEGHRAGTKSVRLALETSIGLGVRWLTLYTFSLENWDRPRAEITELMRLLKRHLLRERPTMMKEGIRLRAVGRRELLPEDVRRTLENLEADTAGHVNLQLVLALSYGSRQEILTAAGRVAALVRAGSVGVGKVDAALFARQLESADLPPVDLLIRTSGEHRLSNFLLWQSPGAHLHFTDTLWPDFRAEHYHRAVEEYQGRVAGRRPDGLLDS